VWVFSGVLVFAYGLVVVFTVLAGMHLVELPCYRANFVKVVAFFVASTWVWLAVLVFSTMWLMTMFALAMHISFPF